ncbi:MAG TPA: PIN domain nuclease [Acidimicrobiia bacterium]|nr:PIN domain nuclease [Acidimicrobiia bacterium]
MILVDASAWIELLRGTGSDVSIRLRAYSELTDEVAITEVVAMELLAGVRGVAEETAVREIVTGIPLLPINGLDDYEHAATLFRVCRVVGETIRQMNDCLVAAVAIRNDVPVLHNDRDFEVLARHTPLRVA